MPYDWTSEYKFRSLRGIDVLRCVAVYIFQVIRSALTEVYLDACLSCARLAGTTSLACLPYGNGRSSGSGFLNQNRHLLLQYTTPEVLYNHTQLSDRLAELYAA